jgi:hypothetical protein
VKYIIDDYSNEGILFVGTNLATTNIIKSGLVDTGIRILYPAHPGYDMVTRAKLINEGQHLQIYKEGVVGLLPESAWNPVYLERRRLVKLRIPLVEQLNACIWSSTITAKQTVWEGIENNLQFALRDCDLARDTYSSSVQEYAQINEISPMAAHREMLLEVENIQNTKVRVYALQKYFTTKINQITTQEEVAALRNRISDIFYKDIFI